MDCNALGSNSAVTETCLRRQNFLTHWKHTAKNTRENMKFCKDEKQEAVAYSTFTHVPDVVDIMSDIGGIGETGSTW